MRTLSLEEMQHLGGVSRCGKLTSYIVTGCAVVGAVVGFSRLGWGGIVGTSRRYARACRRFCS